MRYLGLICDKCRRESTGYWERAGRCAWHYTIDGVRDRCSGRLARVPVDRCDACDGKGDVGRGDGVYSRGVFCLACDGVGSTPATTAEEEA